MAKFNISASSSKVASMQPSGYRVDQYQSPIVVNGYHIGGTGGNTSQSGQQIQPYVKIGTNAAATGNIMQQMGKKLFRVNDGTNVGDCVLSNLQQANLITNTMSIQANVINIVTANVTQFGGTTTANAYVTYATGNVTGPVTVSAAASSQLNYFVFNTGIVGNVTIQNIIGTTNGIANIQIAFPTQTVANVNNQQVTIGFMASRITNKFVSDWGSDGNLSSNIQGGYNPNKYRYHLAPPDATFIQVNSA